MIEEKTPKYFKEFIISFEEFKKHIDEKIENEVDSLAASTAKEFALVHDRLKTTDTRINSIDFELDTVNNLLYRIDEKMGKIEGHIGRYEVRAQNIEHILEKDHKVSIHNLEKTVFGV